MLLKEPQMVWLMIATDLCHFRAVLEDDHETHIQKQRFS